MPGNWQAPFQRGYEGFRAFRVALLQCWLFYCETDAKLMCTESSQKSSFNQCRGLGLETLLVTRPGMISTLSISCRVFVQPMQVRNVNWRPGLFQWKILLFRALV